MERNPAEAVKIIQPLAESGNVQAQVMYGEFFITEENNLAEGRIWLYTAAGSGAADAQYHLAMSYLGSRAVSDIEEGLRWLRKAAEQEYFEAEEQLMLAYDYGRWGLPRDVEQEDFWRERASMHRASRQ
jgi:TPR repeat protein